MPSRTNLFRIGVYLYGIGAIATGIFNFAWGDFETGHEPIQAFGDHIPGRELFAYIVAALLIAGGAAVLWRRTAAAGAIALEILYLMFAIFWLPRLYTAPHVLGFRASVVIPVLAGVCQQIILIAAGAIVYASSATRDSSWPARLSEIARWIFGLCVIDFGLAHLAGLQVNAAFVPKWIPLGGAFWAILTGLCFVMAGIAILAGAMDALAAWLLGVMLLVFSALALAPNAFAAPGNHIAWGSNAYNLAAIGAAWIFAGLAAGIVCRDERSNAVPVSPVC